MRLRHRLAAQTRTTLLIAGVCPTTSPRRSVPSAGRVAPCNVGEINASRRPTPDASGTVPARAHEGAARVCGPDRDSRCADFADIGSAAPNRAASRRASSRTIDVCTREHRSCVRAVDDTLMTPTSLVRGSDQAAIASPTLLDGWKDAPSSTARHRSAAGSDEADRCLADIVRRGLTHIAIDLAGILRVHRHRFRRRHRTLATHASRPLSPRRCCRHRRATRAGVALPWISSTVVSVGTGA